MAKLGWLIWGISFSAVLFIAIYFLLYVRIVSSDAIVILKLGNMDVSFLKTFFSSIKNVIITSLVLGFLLGIPIGIGSRNKNFNANPNPVIQN